MSFNFTRIGATRLYTMFSTAGRSLSAAGLLLLSVTALRADVTYQYTGPNYNNVTGGGPYTTSMHITGSFKVAAAFGPNLNFQDFTPLSFSFNDGVQNFDETTPYAWRGFAVSTDANGAITQWSFGLSGAVGFLTINAPGLILDRGSYGSYLGEIFGAPGQVTVKSSYNITFLPPVKNLPAINMGQSGRTFPLKWQLRDEKGLITDLAVVASLTYKMNASCAAFTADPTGGLPAQATGGTFLRYDVDHYIYNWDTPAQGCYTLFLTLSNGQVFSAYFSFGK